MTLRNRNNLIRIFSYILENGEVRYTDIKNSLRVTDVTLSKDINLLLRNQAISKNGNIYTAMLNQVNTDKMDKYLSKFLYQMKMVGIDNENLIFNLSLLLEYLISKK